MASSSALLSGLLVKRLDHLGPVAGICKELIIAETIDAIIPKSQDCHITHGQALVAMILNGLRFHSRTLHLLNQVILELICENRAGIPVYMQALSGNTNDGKAFADVAKHHIRCLKAAQQSRYFVGDAVSTTLKNTGSQTV